MFCQLCMSTCLQTWDQHGGFIGAANAFHPFFGFPVGLRPTCTTVTSEIGTWQLRQEWRTRPGNAVLTSAEHVALAHHHTAHILLGISPTIPNFFENPILLAKWLVKKLEFHGLVREWLVKSPTSFCRKALPAPFSTSSSKSIHWAKQMVRPFISKPGVNHYRLVVLTSDWLVD